jgi:hypothetical protein
MSERMRDSIDRRVVCFVEVNEGITTSLVGGRVRGFCVCL